MRGFTLVELMIALAIMGVAGAIALPLYDQYIARANRSAALVDFAKVQYAIDAFENASFQLPDTLAQVNMDGLQDAWSQPYVYLRLEGNDPDIVKDFARQDRNLKPINTDYDLYSLGPDGVSKRQLTANESRDDIVRAQNGMYFGYAEDY